MDLKRQFVSRRHHEVGCAAELAFILLLLYSAQFHVTSSSLPFRGAERPSSSSSREFMRMHVTRRGRGRGRGDVTRALRGSSRLNFQIFRARESSPPLGRVKFSRAGSFPYNVLTRMSLLVLAFARWNSVDGGAIETNRRDAALGIQRREFQPLIKGIPLCPPPHKPVSFLCAFGTFNPLAPRVVECFRIYRSHEATRSLTRLFIHACFLCRQT